MCVVISRRPSFGVRSVHVRSYIHNPPPTNYIVLVSKRQTARILVGRFGVATAGSYAYYGVSETTIKPKQAVLFDRTPPSAVSAGMPHEWVEAVVTVVPGTGLVTVSVLEQQLVGPPTGGGANEIYRVHSQSKRLRPLGPSTLSVFNKVPVATTITRLASLRAAAAGGAQAPQQQVVRAKAPPVRRPFNAVNAGAANRGQARPAGTYVALNHVMRAHLHTCAR